jgi:superoxide dismutase
MRKNFKYRFGSFLHRFKKYLPRVYNVLAPSNSILHAVYTSFIKYYLDNKNNIVKEVKFKRKKANQIITPEITKE